ncbi:MAG: hypothetical protein ACRCYQ_12600 [Nocardioides sp.]
MATLRCERCRTPSYGKQYCTYCRWYARAYGRLPTFTERFERVKSWAAELDSSATPAQIEASALAYMAMTPEWRDDPELRARLARVR